MLLFIVYTEFILVLLCRNTLEYLAKGNKGLPLTGFEPFWRSLDYYADVFTTEPSSCSCLFQILSRYDIVQILEIRDSTNTVFEKLRVALNQYVS